MFTGIFTSGALCVWLPVQAWLISYELACRAVNNWNASAASISQPVQVAVQAVAKPPPVEA